MRKIFETMDNFLSPWMLTYWPPAIGILCNSIGLVANYLCQSSDWFKFLNIACITLMLRSAFLTYGYRKKRRLEFEKFRSQIEEMMQGLQPRIQEILDEEIIRQDVSAMESQIMAKARIEILIKQEWENRRIHSSLSKPDKL